MCLICIKYVIPSFPIFCITLSENTSNYVNYIIYTFN
ncbi:hypothetical protein FYM81_04710 [Lactobacillus salivarius]|nr:hypothetical protein [Ligilactobacillus salivarius]